MTPLDAISAGLAAFYLAYVVTRTHGPFGVFDKARENWPHGGLLTCFHCAAMWTGMAAVALVLTPLAPIVWALAAAGAASFLYRYTGGDH
jgi:hypothetical protein